MAFQCHFICIVIEMIIWLSSKALQRELLSQKFRILQISIEHAETSLLSLSTATCMEHFNSLFYLTEPAIQLLYLICKPDILSPNGLISLCYYQAYCIFISCFISVCIFQCFYLLNSFVISYSVLISFRHLLACPCQGIILFLSSLSSFTWFTCLTILNMTLVFEFCTSDII